MKTAICIVLIAALGCNTAANTKPDASFETPALIVPAAFTEQDRNTPEGKWRLIPVLPSDTATGKIPNLNFIMDRKMVTGNTGCNNFSGTFNINKNSLSFNNDFVSTKMACPGYDEAAFERSLLRTNNFEINSDTLCLKENETPLSYWIKVR